MSAGDSAAKISIDFDPGSCLHSLSVWSSCRNCVKGCPSASIHLHENGTIDFDPTYCLGCGTCLSSCPTGCFSSVNYSESRAVRKIVSAHDVSIIRCFLPYDEISFLSGSSQVYQLSTCISSLSPAALFILCFDRRYTISLAECQNCTLFRSTAAVIYTNIRTARRLLSAWAKADNLRVDTLVVGMDDISCGAQVTSDSSQARDAVTEGYTRHHEQYIARRVFDVYSKKMSSQPTRRISNSSRKESSRIFSWREKVESYFADDLTYQNPISWPNHRVRQSVCRMCGICTELCPTGAIDLHRSKSGSSYTFVPGICVECGLCAEVCPNHAISKGTSLITRPFDPKPCIGKTISFCKRCFAPILEPGDHELCSECERELKFTDISYPSCAE